MEEPILSGKYVTPIGTQVRWADQETVYESPDGMRTLYNVYQVVGGKLNGIRFKTIAGRERDLNII